MNNVILNTFDLKRIKLAFYLEILIINLKLQSDGYDVFTYNMIALIFISSWKCISVGRFVLFAFMNSDMM